MTDDQSIHADQTSGRFEVGGAVVYESWAMDRCLWTVPVRVVADTHDLIALFVTVGAEFQRLVQSNGGSLPRVVSRAAFEALDVTTVSGTWRSKYLLVLIRPGHAHAIHLNWSPTDWSFTEYYVNMQEPVLRTATGFRSTDQFLDIVVDPGLAWRWKDDDELQLAGQVGRITEEGIGAIRAEGERVVARIEARAWPFDGSFDGWRPDPSWTIPQLPPSLKGGAMNRRTHIMESVEIRPAVHADIPLLEALPYSAGLPSKHRNRVERQDRDEVRYLLAWIDDQVIGHLLLKWDGPHSAEIRLRAPSCAEIEDFVVAPEWRGQGVGGALLKAADDRCRERGVSRVGLGVGLENPSARAIYEHRSYAFVPDSEHRVTWLQPDGTGREVEAHEDCVFLVKELS